MPLVDRNGRKNYGTSQVPGFKKLQNRAAVWTTRTEYMYNIFVHEGAFDKSILTLQFFVIP